LHVRGNISPATLKRNDVIDDVALPPLEIACPPHELCRAEELRLILPFRARLATVDFFGRDDFRDRVEAFLGFEDVLRDRLDDEECRVDDRPPFCATACNGNRRTIAASTTPVRLSIRNLLSCPDYRGVYYDEARKTRPL